VDNGRLVGEPAPGEALALSAADLGLGRNLQHSAYLELAAVVRAEGESGIFFDQYSADDFKFATLDAENQRVVIGHHTAKRGWQVDTSFAVSLEPGRDYALQIAIKGASLSLTLDGQVLGGFGFNSAVVDGAIGLIASNGAASFDQVTVRTNDPGFVTLNDEALAAVGQEVGTVLFPSPIVQESLDPWSTSGLLEADSWLNYRSAAAETSSARPAEDPDAVVTWEGVRANDEDAEPVASFSKLPDWVIDASNRARSAVRDQPASGPHSGQAEPGLFDSLSEDDESKEDDWLVVPADPRAGLGD
jgi:hypothetical protein